MKIFWSVAAAAILAAAAGAGAYAYALWHTLESSRDLSEILEKRSELAEARQSIGKTNQLLRELEPASQIIRASFVDPQNPLPFIESLERLGARTGVTMTIALAGSGAAPERYSVSAAGSFPNVMAFLKALEATPYETALETADLRGRDKTSVELAVTLRLLRP